jgi:hypothetical protein
VNEEKPFYLHVDASGFAVGAALSQKDDNCVLRPVAFFSRKLKPNSINVVQNGCTSQVN